MPNVLVTHADEPLGRRVVKLLWHDGDVGRIFAVGSGPAPRAFDAYRLGTPPRLVYARVDLARHRPTANLFHSKRLLEAGIDSLVHVPQHGVAAEGPPVVARVPARTVEARHVLQHAIESRTIRSLVTIGSAFVYRLAPGNANHLTEDSDLDLDPDVPADLRAWIDSDMLFHTQVGNPRLRVVLLRTPTVVAAGGYVYLHPALSGRAGPRLRPLGFDPLVSVISDKDVARAVQAALHADCAGVYNVSGRESVPLSVLGSWTRRPCLSVPAPLVRFAASGPGSWLLGGVRRAFESPVLRYGFTLDTRLAERELGYRPRYRIGLERAGDGRLRLETAPA